MSITDVKPDYDIRTSADYLVFGVGAKKRKHKAAGSNRIVPGFYCDLASVDAFVALGDELARKHSRKVKAQSYVLSFPPEEFDVVNSMDLQRVGDAAFLLAKKMHPHSPCLIVVHADGKGRAAHAHIKVLNHDNSTGKALHNFRVHWQVKKANDELMRELDLQVLDVKPKQPTDAWVMRRQELPEFEQILGDACAEAKVEALEATVAASAPSAEHLTARFQEACRVRGVELVIDEHKIESSKRREKLEGESALGYTFKMLDQTGLRPRVRRRKASALSSEFTHAAIVEALDAKQAQLQPPSHANVKPQQVPFPTQIARANRERSTRDRLLAALDDAQAESQIISERMIRHYLRDKQAAKPTEDVGGTSFTTRAAPLPRVRPKTEIQKVLAEIDRINIETVEIPPEDAELEAVETGAGPPNTVNPRDQGSRGNFVETVSPQLSAAMRIQKRQKRLQMGLIANESDVENRSEDRGFGE